jgi:hypothetical protein
MIIFERLGGWGLGNSMFQIATTISIATENNVPYFFPNYGNFKTERYDKCQIFKNKLPFIELSTLNKLKIKRWGHGDFKYIKPPSFDKNDIVIIDGFFQCEKNFNNIRNIIKDIFEISDNYKIYLKQKYKDILIDNACSLHVRRGDYATAKEMKILSIDYYKKAVTYFPEDTLFVVFSDDINWCKSNFDFIKNKTFIEEKNDILELTLMSYFNQNIIANSTFSWWGSWLGEQRKVISPNPHNNWFSDWFYKQEHCVRLNEYDSLICENWITI